MYLRGLAAATATTNSDTSAQNAQIVTSMYQSLFGHAPDPGGLAYWTNVLNTQSVPIDNVQYDIATGAQGTDLTYLVTNNPSYATQVFGAATVNSVLAASKPPTIAAASSVTGTSSAGTVAAGTTAQLPAATSSTVGTTQQLTTATLSAPSTASIASPSVNVSSSGTGSASSGFNIPAGYVLEPDVPTTSVAAPANTATIAGVSMSTMLLIGA